jgi:carboxylesterase type B
MNPAEPIAMATERLLQAGLLGVFVVVFAGAVVVLWRESGRERTALLKQIDDAQKARVEDAKAAHAQMLAVIQQCTSALGTAATTSATQKEAINELRDTLRNFGEELRSFGDDFRRPRSR